MSPCFSLHRSSTTIFASLPILLLNLVIAQTALAATHLLPDYASITLHRTGFHLEFRWLKDIPNFPPGTTVEFQVAIDPSQRKVERADCQVRILDRPPSS